MRVCGCRSQYRRQSQEQRIRPKPQQRSSSAPRSTDRRAQQDSVNSFRLLTPRVPQPMMLATGDTTIVIRHMKSSSAKVPLRWSLLTNHGHVLAYVAGHSDARLRDIAESIGITERTVAQIVNDLEEAGHLTKTRDGRRNLYDVHEDKPLRHPRHSHHTVGELIRFLEAPSGSAPRRARGRV